MSTETDMLCSYLKTGAGYFPFMFRPLVRRYRAGISNRQLCLPVSLWIDSESSSMGLLGWGGEVSEAIQPLVLSGNPLIVNPIGFAPLLDLISCFLGLLPPPK